jgi:hypothetical protein
MRIAPRLPHVALTGTSSLTRCRLSRVETDPSLEGDDGLGVVLRSGEGNDPITAKAGRLAAA